MFDDCGSRFSLYLNFNTTQLSTLDLFLLVYLNECFAQSYSLEMLQFLVRRISSVSSYSYDMVRCFVW